MDFTCPASKHLFMEPTRAISTPADLTKFAASKACHDLLHFVRIFGESTKGCEFSNSSSSSSSSLSSSSDLHAASMEADSCIPPENSVVSDLAVFLRKLGNWVEEIPPIKQPMRFGNKAFREWHLRLLQVFSESVDYTVLYVFTSLYMHRFNKTTPEFLSALLESRGLSDASLELSHYLCSSFGNETRIDYGTGHENNFVVFLYCLFQLQVFAPQDLQQVMSQVFREYIKTMRRLQEVYVLEPAGSHGVWGLDGNLNLSSAF